MEYPLIYDAATSLAAILTALPVAPAFPPSDLSDPSSAPGEAGSEYIAVRRTDLFREVRVLCLSGYEHLFQLLPELSFFPAAIVCVGGGDFSDVNAYRELELAIIVVDELRLVEDQAQASYALLDKVSSALTGDVPGVPLELDEVQYFLKDFRSLELDNSHVAYVFTVNTMASCQA